jgi:mxaJ protein
MSSASERAALMVMVAAGAIVIGHSRPAASDIVPTAPPNALRICSDPNNLPFSNARGEGFENRIAQLAAHRLGRKIEYYWRPQRRGFIRATLGAGVCDVVMGALASSGAVMTTRPYYRSAYVFVSRRDRHMRVRSFDDPRLKSWRVAIQLTGDDYGNPPPAQALAARHILQNVRGYTVFGDYSKPEPQRAPIDAVSEGSVDVAIVWGPVGGYFGQRVAAPMDVTPVSPLQDGPHLPLAFDISMAVRQGDGPLAAALNDVIEHNRGAIGQILREYHVPLVARRQADS